MANSAFDYNVSGNEAPSPNAKAVAEKLTVLQANISTCAVCDKRVYDNEKFVLDQRIYHKVCFRCATCRSTLTVKTFRLGGGMLYCHRHYLESFHKFNNYDFKESPRRPSIESHVTSPMTSSAAGSNDRNLVRERTTERQISYDRPSVQVPKAGERPPMVEITTSPTGSGHNANAVVSNIRAMFETGVKGSPNPSAYGQEKRNDAAVLSMMMSQSTAKARMAKFSGSSIDETPPADSERGHSHGVIETSTHSSGKLLSLDDNDNDSGSFVNNNNHHHHQQHQHQFEEEEEEEEEEREQREVDGGKGDHHAEDSDHDREVNRSADDDDETEAQHLQHYSNQQQHLDYNDDDEEHEDGYQQEENGEYNEEENDQE